jgi:hypothetical protein
VGDRENEVRAFFRHLGASAGLHPSVADKVSDVIVGPESEDATEDKGSE